MCITSTARRRNLTLQVLPSHLLSGAKQHSNNALAQQLIQSSTSSKRYMPSNYFQQQHCETVNVQAKTKAPVPLPVIEPTPPDAYSHDHSHSHVVKHNYHDHSKDPTVDPSQIKHKAKGGVITPFPVKLHEMLDKIEADGLAHVVSWQPHGRCFVVHKPKEFVNHVMPKYFKQTKIASFQRQLNLYGFNRLTGGLDKGGYYHELFLRGKVSLAYDINRMRVKGTGVRLPTNPDNEPNFYALEPVTKDDVSSTKSTSPINSLMEAKPTASTGEKLMDMEKRRAELKRESEAHAKKIATAMYRPAPKRAVKTEVKQEEEDVVFFEGCPFHYLDPSSLAPVPEAFVAPQPERTVTPAKLSNSRQLFHSTSTVVSDSEEDVDFVPSFSAANMDWEGPLSAPSLQAHMRRTSFQSFNNEATPGSSNVERRPLDDDIENFFQKFEMPVDRYHNQIEQMSENDDTAFGFLLEQAISE